jgi:hypothetical protein
MAPLICWSFSNSTFKYLLVDQAVRKCQIDCVWAIRGRLTMPTKPEHFDELRPTDIRDADRQRPTSIIRPMQVWAPNAELGYGVDDF